VLACVTLPYRSAGPHEVTVAPGRSHRRTLKDPDLSLGQVALTGPLVYEARLCPFPRPGFTPRELALILPRDERMGANIFLKHPLDGRWILQNGYDWTYFLVEDVPYFIVSVRAEKGDAILRLSDGSEEPLNPTTLRVSPRDELYVCVKAVGPPGPYDAKFTRFAQTQLAPFLHEGEHGEVRVVTARGAHVVPRE
jgi:hypothetical protein